jgi:lysophospholipase L1-like esterase
VLSPFIKISKNILAILFGLLLSFLLLEGLLRVFQPIEYRVKGQKLKLPRDKKYQFTNDKTDKLDRVISTNRNHLGFRGGMPPKDFTDYVTIIAVGGSTTACEMVSDGKTWTDLLADQLTSRLGPVWLNNAGLDGTSTYGHLILMEDYLIKMRPKVVLLLVGANDIGLGNYNKWDLESLKKPTTGYMASLWAKLINASEVLGYAINFQRYARAKKLGLTHQIFDFADLPPTNYTQEGVDKLLQLHRQSYLQPFQKRLVRLIEICRQNGIEPVLITQPTAFGEVIDPTTGTDLGRAGTYGLSGKAFWRLLELYNGVTRDTAAQYGVELIDLAGEMPKSSAYYYDAYHFSNAGCVRVAAIIDRHLEPFLARKYPQLKIQGKF